MSRKQFIATILLALSTGTALAATTQPAEYVKASFATVEPTVSPGVLAYELDVECSKESVLDSTAPQLEGEPAGEIGHSPIKYGSLGFSRGAYRPLAGALGDSLSTAAALTRSGVGETNGLVNTSPGGLIGLFAVKSALIYYADHQPQHIRKPALKLFSGLWNGVTASNLLVAAGAANPIALVGGAAFGYYMYRQEENILEIEEKAKL